MKLLAPSLSLLLLGACHLYSPNLKEPDFADAAGVSVQKAELGEWGVDLTGMDSSVAPGDSFFRFANGRWLDGTDIPANKSTYGTREHLVDKSSEHIAEIVKTLSKTSGEEGSLAQKVGDYYSSYCDTSTIDGLGLAPLKAHLDNITSISNRSGVLAQLASVHSEGLVKLMVLPDPADATRNTAFTMQAGLGMLNRDYYLSGDKRYIDYRNAYKNYIKDVLSAISWVDPAAGAQAIFLLEEKLAHAHWPELDNRVLEKIYNPMTVKELNDLAPQIDWLQYFGQLGLGGQNTIVVMQPTALQQIAKIFDETDTQTWKSYLAFHLARKYSEYLPGYMSDLHFNFFKKTLRGIPEPQHRNERGVELINKNLGGAVGKLYIERHFPESSKVAVHKMVDNILMAMQEKLRSNQWMDEPTREQALSKLATMDVRIGYPDKWTDYSSLHIAKGDALGNAMRIDLFNWGMEMNKLHAEVDRGVWFMPPQLVKAYNMPMVNQITFHAGMLQAPYYDPNADAAVNYGAIGVVIAHEITHGYDDQGRKFDERGRVRDWWSEHSSELFQTKSKRLAEQFNQYSPAEGLHVNGKLTLGENIADLAGVDIAYAAYQQYKLQHGEANVLNSFTGDQRFFLAYAQVFREKSREQTVADRLLKDPHSPAEFRVDGIVKNVDAWYKAFNIEKSDTLYLKPADRASIW